jgi:hypothetical protein
LRVFGYVLDEGEGRGKEQPKPPGLRKEFMEQTELLRDKIVVHVGEANETHTVIYGTFIMQHDGGQKEALGPGSYNRMPSKMIHEAWSPPDEGNLVFITVDGPWDLNLVDGRTGKMPPK